MRILQIMLILEYMRNYLIRGYKMVGWQLKTFKTKEKMIKFIQLNRNKIQYREIFANNEYAIEYKKLLKIY